MAYRRLFIWVEGADDRRFFERVVVPLLKQSYDYITIVEYATKSKESIKNYFKSILRMEANYIFVADFDSAACISRRKQKELREVSVVSAENIAVVVQEIEGWYLAGLAAQEARKLGVRSPDRTDDIKKENFDAIIPKRFGSRIDFMIEILNHYSIDAAKDRNASFSYFLGKYCS